MNATANRVAVLDATALQPCPFCGGRPTVEADPLMADSVRIACGNPSCRVAPRTEYLLTCYAAELRAVWNGRPVLLSDVSPGV